jgi:hypothetical protein
MGGDADNPFFAEEAIVMVQYFCDASLQAFREGFFYWMWTGQEFCLKSF